MCVWERLLLVRLCAGSGTTGDPKGAVLTHRSLVADIAAALMHSLSVKPSDVHISYLPLAHIFERVFSDGILMCGASMGFYRGDGTPRYHLAHRDTAPSERVGGRHWRAQAHHLHQCPPALQPHPRQAAHEHR